MQEGIHYLQVLTLVLKLEVCPFSVGIKGSKCKLLENNLFFTMPLTLGPVLTEGHFFRVCFVRHPLDELCHETLVFPLVRLTLQPNLRMTTFFLSFVLILLKSQFFHSK